MRRKEEITTEVVADWCIHADADELRSSPWPGVALRDAIYHVDRAGFNAVDHTSLQFRPIDNGYPNGADFEDYFRFFDFDFTQKHQIKAWKNTGRRVFPDAGGHRAAFAGRRVYPYNFAYKQYPIRSQRHGERKYFVERQARLNAEERAGGWHGTTTSTAQVTTSCSIHPSCCSLTKPDFYRTFLIERLANIGPDQRAAWAARQRRRALWRRLSRRVRRHLEGR